MKLTIKKGSTSVALYVFVQDSSSTTGAGKTGLAYNTASLTAYYVRPLGSAVAITLATQTVTGAYSSGGFVEVDATNMPGVYRIDIPDAAIASGVNSVVVMLKGASGMAPLVMEIELVAYDPQDAAALGLSRVDAAISSRSTYAGADTSGTTTLLSRLTATRAGNLDNLDAAISGIAAAVWAAGTRTLTSFGTIVADAAAAVWAAGTRTLSAFGFTVATNSDSNVTAIKAKTDNLPASPAATGDAMALTSGERNSTADAILARALAAESYAADGGTPTLSQMLWMIWAGLVDYSITGTTLTVNKQDGTAAMTFTLDDASSPTSRTRST